MKLRIQKDGNRYCLWPIRIGWQTAVGGWKAFGRHGWQVGCEGVPESMTGYGCMPGFRKVFGQTFHLGPVKIMCGPSRGEKWCERAVPS